MKDRVFEGRDVPRALEAASLGLGQPVSRLRYVVLEEGRPETASVPAAPARIAVLLDAMGERQPGPPDAPRRAPEKAPAASPGGVKGRLRRMVEAVAEAAGAHLEVAFEDLDETLVVRVSGPGEALLLDAGGEALRALEHLLQRSAANEDPRRVQLTSERFRSERDALLRERAHALAELVRGDGAPRESEPLNSYERRILHIALQAEPGVRSFSVGEGAGRRVTVAPATDATPGPERP